MRGPVYWCFLPAEGKTGGKGQKHCYLHLEWKIRGHLAVWPMTFWAQSSGYTSCLFFLRSICTYNMFSYIGERLSSLVLGPPVLAFGPPAIKFPCIFSCPEDTRSWENERILESVRKTLGGAASGSNLNLLQPALRSRGQVS